MGCSLPADIYENANEKFKQLAKKGVFRGTREIFTAIFHEELLKKCTRLGVSNESANPPRPTPSRLGAFTAYNADEAQGSSEVPAWIRDDCWRAY